MDTTITDTDRIDALEKMGNIAIWHGVWGRASSTSERDQRRIISEMDDDGEEVGDEVASGTTIRKVIDDWIRNNY